MLKVNCGAAGRVRVVKENPATGAVTEVIKDNVWTDAGFGRISNPALGDYPSRIAYGSGARGGAHESVTSLEFQVGISNADYGSYSTADKHLIVGDAIVVEKTRSVTQNQRQQQWTLSEIGLMSSTYQGAVLMTYVTLDEPVVVSPVEIITIYYTIQVVFPASLTGLDVEIEAGLPPTKADYSAALVGGLYAVETLQPYTTAPSGAFYAFTSSSGAGAVAAAGRTSINNSVRFTFTEGQANRESAFFGVRPDFSSGPTHMLTLAPPITKTNKQVLEFTVRFEYSRSSVIDIE